jgi:hypothetical protein
MALLVDKRLFAGVAQLENPLPDPCVSAFVSPLEFGFNFGSESIYSLKTERPSSFISHAVSSKMVICINFTFGLTFHTYSCRVRKEDVYDHITFAR